MRDIRLITFDLDDTLWSIAPIIERAEHKLHQWLLQNCPRAAHQFNPAALRALRIETERLFPELQGDISELRRKSIALALERSQGPVERADEAFAVFWEARNEVELFDDVMPTLRRLQSRYSLAAVSNGNACIDRTGLADVFAFGLNARDVGAAKPDREIFLKACDIGGVAPAQVLHVGDDIVCDVEGALDAGLKAAWLNREGEHLLHPRADEFLQFTDLTGLADHLEG